MERILYYLSLMSVEGTTSFLMIGILRERNRAIDVMARVERWLGRATLQKASESE